MNDKRARHHLWTARVLGGLDLIPELFVHLRLVVRL
jgi:hypothetical protein